MTRPIASASLAAFLAAAGGAAAQVGDFKACPDGTELMDITPLHVDADGRIDLAVVCGPEGASTEGGLTRIWTRTETGGFQTAGDLRPGDAPDEAAAGDLDGDGDQDLAVIAQGQSERAIAIFENRDGAFAEQPVAYDRGGARTRDLVVHDGNQDGRMDLVLAASLPPEAGAELLANEGDGAIGPFDARPLLPDAPRRKGLIAEMSDDHVPDLALVGEDGRSVTLFAGGSDDRLELTLDAPIEGVVAGGRVNDDASPDLLVTRRLDAYVVQTHLALSEGRTLEPGDAIAGADNPVHAFVRNLGGDSRPELIVIGRDSALSDHPQALVYRPAESGVERIGRIPLGGYPDAARMVDLDGDGAAELVTGHIVDSRIRIHRWESLETGPVASDPGAPGGAPDAEAGAADCGEDPACFEARFADCEPARLQIRPAAGLAYDYRIEGPQGEACAVRAEFLANPNPAFVGKAMVCLYDPSQALQPQLENLEPCEGELAELMDG